MTSSLTHPPANHTPPVLPGGRDKRNGPVVSMTQPEQGSVEMLMEIMMQDVIDMLAYFTSVPK